jgi:hypothetical protein
MTRRRTTRVRKYVSLRKKLAAALSMLLPQDVRDDLRERRVPAKMVIGLFDQDHVVLHAFGGPDEWWNFTPMLRAPHRKKSAGDTSIVAKSDRIKAEHDEHRRRMLKPSRRRKPKGSIPSRGFQQGHRPLRNRNNFERRPG